MNEYKTKVLVFPKDINPYQDLLYAEMNDYAEIRYFQPKIRPRIMNLLFTPIELAFFRLFGFKILHIHWFYPFSFSNNNKGLMKVSEFYLKIFLACVSMFGYKLIWTVHDLLPHERTFIDDAKMSKKIAMFADALIVPNSQTKKELIENFNIPNKKITLIPLGNFVGYYPESNKKITEKSNMIYLFFGQIKPYKGIDSLIKNFKDLPDLSAELQIVGPCHNTQYLDTLRDLIGQDRRITLTSSFVPNDQIAELFAQADIVVLPFQEVTNTSSALLAFSLKKPVIAPLLGMIKDFPGNTGFYYDQNDTTGLKQSMIFAIKSKKNLPDMCQNAYKYAQTLNWVKIAYDTHSVYTSVLL
jgi:glycosyltransferase involved in cell wall biosynthesis